MSALEHQSSGREEGLTPDRYERVHDLLDQAWMCPPRLRKVFLAGACGPDSALLREALALLEARETLDSDDGASLEIGALVGRYRVERDLGRGGMGVVYLVSRVADASASRFALKLMRSDVDDEGIVKRFALERRVLASLEHPNIARLIDAGEASDGRPYLVMEYVDGVPLDEYADREGHSVRERLELFQIVCSAVDHAHQRGVVHRDIKPSNILVTASGIPKLLDFGIARLTRASGQESGRLTATNAAPGTPLYASPEQLQGRIVDARADVYTLGVVLFELLTGWWPFVSRHAGGGSAAARPSDALTSRPELLSVVGGGPVFSVAAVAKARGTTPARLLRELRGDLDAIVTTALREDADERYRSVRELNEDVQRYLEGRPVAARGDTLAYRATRFGSRHRTGVLVAMLLLGGAGWGLVLRPLQPPSNNPSPNLADVVLPSPNLATPPPQGQSVGLDASLSNKAPAVAPGQQVPESRSAREAAMTSERDSANGQPTSTQESMPTGEAVPSLVASEQDLAGLSGGGEGLSLNALIPPGASTTPDRERILAILEHFADIYRSENTAEFKELYPSLRLEELAALDRDFVLAAHDVAMTDVIVQVRGERAIATCQWTLRIEPIEGSARTRSGRATFQFARAGGQWVITSVTLPR